MENIRKSVERVFKLDIGNTTRQLPYVEARACYYTLCADLTAFSLTAIAKSINKNHATIIHALKEFPYMMKKNPDLKIMYHLLKKEMLGIEMSIDKPEDLLFNYHRLLLQNIEMRNTITEKDKIIEMLKMQIR
jgi:hypothetical protein